MIRATAHGRKHSFKASGLLSNPLPGQNGLLTSRLIREILGYIFCFLKAKFKVSLNANRGNRRYGPHFHSQFPTAIKKTRTKKDLDYINNNHLSNSLFY